MIEPTGKLVGYMAINEQDGQTIHLTEPKFPRRQLMAKLGASRCDRMFVDKKDGNTVHCGYIVNGQWYRLYQVRSWEKEF